MAKNLIEKNIFKDIVVVSDDKILVKELKNSNINTLSFDIKNAELY